VVILLGFLTWLFWPRKFPRTRKRLLIFSGLVFLFSVILGLNTYWPREYDKNYLEAKLPADQDVTPLRELADSNQFYIGVALSPDPIYGTEIIREFNSLVGENHFMPGKLLVDAGNWTFDFSGADKLMTFAEANGMRMRGHTLVWGKFPGMTFPKQWIERINTSTDPKATMEMLIKKYIETVMGHYKGRLNTWDVVNEPMAGTELYPSIFTKSMGEGYIDFSFRTAREDLLNLIHLHVP